MPVSVIGTRGSGKSTFIDLLYQTMEYYTNDPVTEGALKYYWRPEFQDQIIDELNTMRSGGKYPFATDTGKELIYSFLVGFNPGRIEQLGGRLKEYLIKGGEFNDFLCLIMDLFDIAGEDLEKYSREPESCDQLIRMFNNDIFVMTINASNFTLETDGPLAAKQRKYDKLVSGIISGFIKHRSLMAQKDPNFNKAFHPIFVLTQVDGMDGRIMKEHGVDEIVKPEKDNTIDPEQLIQMTQLYRPDANMKKLWKQCNEACDSVMKSHMQATTGLLNGAQLMNVPMGDDNMQYFLSWTANDMRGEKEFIKTGRMLYSSSRTYETPIYSRHMYVAFIAYLRRIASITPDHQSLITRMLDDSNWNNPPPNKR